jgi:signal transduction protein with GAF and PtsI domain
LATSLTVVYLKDRSLDELAIVDALGDQSDALIGVVLPLGTRVSGWVAANGRAIVNTDAKLEFPTWGGIGDEIVCAALPIRSTTDAVGVLLVVRSSNRPFETEEVKFLEMISTKFDDPPLRDMIARAGAADGVTSHGNRARVH